MGSLEDDFTQIDQGTEIDYDNLRTPESFSIALLRAGNRIDQKLNALMEYLEQRQIEERVSHG
jgi:hypothetical protein